METPLPKDSQRRKIVLVIPSHDIEKCEIEGESVLFKNNDVSILEVPVSDKNAEIVRDLAKKGLLTQYRVLVQEPFSDDAYEDLSDAPVKFTIKKAMLFSTLCAHLGAKKVHVLEVKAKRILKEQDFKASTTTFLSQITASSVTQSSGEVKILAEKEESLRSSIKLEDSFQGAEVDIERAKALVEKYNLGNDFNILSLLETMSGKNRLIKRKFTIDIFSEMKGVLSILGRLSFPGFIDLAGSYKNFDDINVCYSITFEVEF